MRDVAAVPSPIFSKTTNRPFRKSGLRKSINIEDAADLPLAGDDNDGPVVVKPSLSRAGSTKKKGRKSGSRLSFGGRADEDDETERGGTAAELPSTPKKGSNLKKVIALKDLAMRQRSEDEDQPKYTKEYLEDLANSTPNTPQDRSVAADEDANMSFDISEVEGAVVVNVEELATSNEPTRVLSEVEIREKKERRARLAREEQEEEFISLDDHDSAREKQTRLVREDEDLGEGFDEFVEDGGIALGRKAEREARKRRRQEMASLISQAEGNSEDESDESDAERRAAFEAAQTRAGMDGLKRPHVDPEQVHAMKPKIAPLPEMSECLEEHLQAALRRFEQELAAKSQREAELRKDKEEITLREEKLQTLLNEAGEKLQAAMGNGTLSNGVAAAGGATPATGSPARPNVIPGEMNEFAMERGLESFGTPSRQDDDDTETR